MIADPQLRWVVTVALIAAAALCGAGLMRRRRTCPDLASSAPRAGARSGIGVLDAVAAPAPAGARSAVSVVGHVLHVVMAVAMIDMAWPSAMYLPLPAGVVVFAVFAGWYVVVTVTGRYRPVNGVYHVLMMAAMAWMYAVMSDDVVARSGGGMGGGDMGGINTGGMQMSAFIIPLAHDHSGGAGGMSMADGLPAWAVALDWLCVVGFAAAALWWLGRYFRAAQGNSRTLNGDTAGAMCQVLMAAGMAAMFAVMV